MKKFYEESNLEQKKSIERKKLEEIKQKTLLRAFDFEDSIIGNIQLISNYKALETQKKIREIIPKRKENSISKEYVRELLQWYQHQIVAWCNKPKCPLCDTDKNIEPTGVYKPNEFKENINHTTPRFTPVKGVGGRSPLPQV